mmetsp:Transcript_9338/g.24092  ORF Transcript_9338/g.24092 Transcript_9338/m.24092 type:complete len:203 (-) Transcript_9338:337-945(-)
MAPARAAVPAATAASIAEASALPCRLHHHQRALLPVRVRAVGRVAHLVAHVAEQQSLRRLGSVPVLALVLVQELRHGLRVRHATRLVLGRCLSQQCVQLAEENRLLLILWPRLPRRRRRSLGGVGLLGGWIVDRIHLGQQLAVVRHFRQQHLHVLLHRRNLGRGSTHLRLALAQQAIELSEERLAVHGLLLCSCGLGLVVVG